MRAIGAGLAVLLLGGCLSTTVVTSSTGNSIGTGAGSSGTGTVAGVSTTGGASSTGGISGTSSGAGGSSTGGTTGRPGCLTAADCTVAGDVCLDGGQCGPPAVASSLSCIPVGSTCMAGSVCCQGTCGEAGFCTAWSACGLLGQQCSTGTDCCWNEGCDAGVCAPACGNLATACAHDSDCCGALGLVCRPPVVPTGNALECVSERSPNGKSCTPQKTSTTDECNLGTGCAIKNDVDPCAPAGFVCDPFLGVCRQPGEFETCVPGGPACLGISDSAVGGLQCIDFPQVGYALCVQPCQETSDCIDPAQSCQNVPDGDGEACFGNFGCKDFFGSCTADVTGDGTCVPAQTASGVQGLCYQSQLDAGISCDDEGNRQNGGLCGTGDTCIAGLCTELCNGGTSGIGPTCGSGTCVAGPAQGDATDYAVCEQNCDFTDPDGGGCPSSPEVPEKCIAAFQDGFPDFGNGFCALEVENPPALGQPCSQQDPLHLDTCGPGQACAAQNGGSQVICVQLCTSPGSQSTCPAGQTCQFWYTNGARSIVMGSCG